MKLSCPECSGEFDVPDAVIGDAGRRVKCASCGNIWFQEPEREESFGGFRSFDEDLDVDPIPASLYPHDDDEDDNDRSSVMDSVPWPALFKIIMGIIIAIVIVWLLLWGSVKAGYSVNLLKGAYNTFGIEVSAPGAMLKIDGVEAKVVKGEDGTSFTALQGYIENKGKSAQSIPVIEITHMTDTGEEGDSTRIKLEKTTLKSGEKADFTAELPVSEAGAKVRLRFVE